MFVQLSHSLPHLNSSVHTTLFPLHEHLCEHFDFSELHLTSCSTETGAGATRERTGTSFWSRYLHSKVSGSRQVWPNTISWCHILAWTWARRISPCSLGWWQFVNSLFISQLLEQKTPEHLCFPDVDSTRTEKRAQKLSTAT